MPRKPNPDQESVRNIAIRYLVTPNERKRVERMATEQGLSMSGLVRKLLGLPPRY